MTQAVTSSSSSEMENREDSGLYSIYDVANWFLQKQSMTHKKVQKLCYYAQAWYYALKDKRLIKSDFQAWVNGPVSPILYQRFKSYGYADIPQNQDLSCLIKEEDTAFLERVWATYGDQSGNSLEILTHRELPWIEARCGYADNERCNVVISPETMKKFYQSIYIGNET